MSYWGKITKQAWADTRAVVRLDHWARIALTIGGAIAAGVVTWLATGGTAWSAIATIGMLAVVSLAHFLTRLVQIPAERAKITDDAAAKDKPSDPARDTSLTEALCYAKTGQMGQRPVNLDASVFLDISDELKRFVQLAADGIVRVWGKTGYGDVYALIPTEYWLTHQPEWFSLLKGEPRTESLTGKAVATSYSDLMVSRHEIDMAFNRAG